MREENHITTEDRLRELFHKVQQELLALGIPLAKNIAGPVINSRPKKRLGCCRRSRSLLGGAGYTIEISKVALSCPEKELCGIIAHELLHTCPGCFDHGNKWKTYGRLIEQSLGYRIKRAVEYKTLGMEEPQGQEQYQYSLTCPNCGQVYLRKRMCPLIKNPKRYRCGKCGSSLAKAQKSTISCR